MIYEIKYTIGGSPIFDYDKFKKIKYKGRTAYTLKNTIHKNKFEDKYNMSYVNHSGLNSNRPSEMFNYIKKYFNKSNKILELGCGEGDFALELWLSFGDNINYLGIDIEPDLIEVSKMNVPSYKFKIFDLNNEYKITENVDILVALGCGSPGNIYTWKNIKKLYNPKYIIIETRYGEKINNKEDKEYYSSIFSDFDKILGQDYNLIDSKIFKFKFLGFNGDRKLVVYGKKD